VYHPSFNRLKTVRGRTCFPGRFLPFCGDESFPPCGGKPNYFEKIFDVFLAAESGFCRKTVILIENPQTIYGKFLKLLL